MRCLPISGLVIETPWRIEKAWTCLSFLSDERPWLCKRVMHLSNIGSGRRTEACELCFAWALSSITLVSRRLHLSYKKMLTFQNP